MRFQAEQEFYKLRYSFWVYGALAVIAYIWHRDGFSTPWVDSVLTLFIVWIILDMYTNYADINGSVLATKTGTFTRQRTIDLNDCTDIKFIPQAYRSGRFLRVIATETYLDVHISDWEWDVVKRFLSEVKKANPRIHIDEAL